MRCKSYEVESTRQAPFKVHLRVHFYNIFQLKYYLSIKKVAFYKDTIYIRRYYIQLFDHAPRVCRTDRVATVYSMVVYGIFVY